MANIDDVVGLGIGVGSSPYLVTLGFAPAHSSSAPASGQSNHAVDGPCDTRLVIHARADNPFRLNVMSTVDNWATYETVKQMASSVVNVDGGTAGYVNAATLNDFCCPSIYRVEIESDVVTLNSKVDIREITEGR